MRTAIVVGVMLAGVAGAEAERSLKDAPASLASSVVLAGADEPGQRMLLTIVLIDGGDRPVPNAVLYAYHTDAKGSYGPGGNRDPRIFGYARSDASGRVVLDSIKPGPYPQGGTAAHVHVHVAAAGREVVDECWFTGDRYLRDEIRTREQARGTLSRVITLTSEGAKLRGTWTLSVAGPSRD